MPATQLVAIRPRWECRSLSRPMSISAGTSRAAATPRAMPAHITSSCRVSVT